ncbi:hypothetical protein [Aurantiacibacter sediminis]|uniref:Lipoprotein n=1 Tax=Aurantiacibacter sediminis TaxID=2793064 RepID=A0ABS0N496_9SPHN|nr:hypothetical protein [Aurantiacibacter sediminis]MBH5322778.1 hypothetical protein [Aurantiacibacter sediminis]
MIRFALACATFLLAGCSETEDQSAGTPVACAIGGAPNFADDCTMERADREGERLVIVRHPDGVFRRFEIGVPERGLITADGVEQAAVERRDGFVEVRVGADRYRLPISD